jgi:iron(III) transport system substrate-binding protein
MKKYLVILLAMFMFVLVACGNNSEKKHDTSSNRSDSIENNSESNDNNSDEGAKIEGELEFYTSQPDVDAEQLVAAFNEKYPHVKVNIFRSGTEEVMSKINAEDQAGEVLADVVLLADSVTFEGLKSQDMLLAYESPEDENIPSEFVDPDHMYTGTKIMATGLVINTENVKEKPTSWHELVAEEAANQIVMPSPLYSGAAAYNLGVFTRNDDFGWDFYEGLKENNPMITEGNGAVMENVASGQKSFGLVVDYLVARAAKDGSPVEFIYPEEGVPVITEPIGIMEKTDQEEAAKAFYDYVLSEKGQQLQAEIGYTPIRKGIEAPEGLKSFDEINVLEATIEEMFQNREADKEQFDKLFAE